MRHFLLSGLLWLGVWSLAAQPQAYLEAFTRGDYKPKRPAEVYHMNDGQRYTSLSDDGKRIVAYEYASGREVATLFDIDKIADCPIAKIEGYAFAPNEERLLVHTESHKIYRRSVTASYYVYYLKRNKIEPLSDSDNVAQEACFSPDGRIVAFARDNNLFLKKLDFGTELAITTDGAKGRIINGTADWSYEEEFCQTRYFEWSADSKLLAYVRFDESEVGEYTFQNFAEGYPTSVSYKYPRAGGKNSRVQLLVYDVQNRTTKQMRFDDDNDIYIPIIRWTNDANTLAAVRLDRSQTQLDVMAFNARSGVGRRIMSESGATYVDYANLNSLHFNADNSFVALSERDGWRHLYLFDANGSLVRQITSGNWDVTAFYGYDEQTKTAYFQAAKESPINREVYKADAKGRLSRIGTGEGICSAEFSKLFAYAIYQFDNTETPNLYTIIDNKGKTLRTIENNAALKATADALNLSQKEFFTFETSEGITLNGWIVKPKNMAAGAKLPLVMVQYSGPNSQEVLNRFHLDWEFYLPQMGYVVACVDGRGTGARGRDFRTCTYKKLGELETKDQVEAARYLGTLDFVDSGRIAIWGWSYGGFMTLSCLTNGAGVFKAGIAIAPVTDWRYYDTAYSERFMNRPQENDRGYALTSLLDKADRLQGELLLVHGTADDNVHTQQSWLYIEQLVKAGKQFEMQMYPNKNHSILGAEARLHLYTRCTRFLQKKL